MNYQQLALLNFLVKITFFLYLFCQLKIPCPLLEPSRQDFLHKNRTLTNENIALYECRCQYFKLERMYPTCPVGTTLLTKGTRTVLNQGQRSLDGRSSGMASSTASSLHSSNSAAISPCHKKAEVNTGFIHIF